MDKKLYHRLQKDTEEIVERAAQLLHRYQSKVKTVTQKDSVDIATNADVAAEKLIINFIRKKYPDHSIYSEEAGTFNNSSEFRWIIDPLDGTKEYAKGSQEYNCLVAVEHRGTLVAGAGKRKSTSELFSSGLRLGAFCNNKKVHVSKTSKLNLSMLGFRIPANNNSSEVKDRSFHLLRNLNEHCYRIRPGWDDFRLTTFVATGTLDAHFVLNNAIRWYDVAPAVLLVTEAGGMVSDWFGKPIKNGDLTPGLLVSNGHLHDELLEQIVKYYKA